MEKLGSHWTDFHEIWYLSIFFRKSLEKILVSLKSDKNNGYVTWRPSTFMTIYRWVLLRMRNVSYKRRRENQNIHFIFSNFFPPPEIIWVMWKNTVKPDRLLMTISHGACALHAGYRHTLGICNTYCFSTATVVTRTHLHVTLHVHCLSFSVLH